MYCFRLQVIVKYKLNYVNSRNIEKPQSITLTRCRSQTGIHGSMVSVAVHHSQEEIIATGSSDGVLGIWDTRKVWIVLSAVFMLYQFTSSIFQRFAI